ncbi:hypothetical protein JX266_011505 [Neoarthrinium moseri]|uniref:uncharacterized protein n=1 Tax=Neoarthrinium moseri TaxID=1658444 RepID=UPI001FDCCE2A|nr:uncharacterized protein JN550_012162 [Neoarthrinium moseri]KAI1842337.1 hypothetical protein JX266_011505 [Neoarthrinium moseri]KAI1859242.1 hypothetical protein JN550_012162 [Neoarthrinium moseri]
MHCSAVIQPSSSIAEASFTPDLMIAVDNMTSPNDVETVHNAESPVESAPYSVLSPNRKRGLVYLLAYLSLASSLTATIYFPLIDMLAELYQTSIQNVNLTITVYLVVQGISPSFWAPLAETLGRRPVFLLTFLLYTLASLGLALSAPSRSYLALIILRGVQSAGGSVVLALAYAVVADVVVHAERGKYLGPMLAAANLGPCFGPIIGGAAILSTCNPAWCFWVLFIFGLSAFSLVGFFLPETLRSIAGNGSIHTHSIWNTWAVGLDGVFTKFRNRRGGHTQQICKCSSEAGPLGFQDGKWSLPNPVSSIRCILHWDTFIILWLAASPYALWYAMQSSIPLIYGTQYGFNHLTVGFSYLAGGGGVIMGALSAGRLMDWNYRHVAKSHGLAIDNMVAGDLAAFPIMLARSRGSVLILSISCIVVVGWAWSFELQVHPSVPLILQAYVGWKVTVLHQFFSALIVDLYPLETAPAAAANNITRCTLSAIAVATLEPLAVSLGRAWSFTIFGLIDGLGCIVLVVALRRWGTGWRDRREASSH